MASSRRLQRLDQVLREEIAKILDRELEFQDGVIVTLTRVAVSPDARYATAFISILPVRSQSPKATADSQANRTSNGVLGGKERQTLEILGKNVYYIQQLLNRRLRMRPVPKIRFAIDEGEIRREVVEKSLAELRQSRQL